MISTRRSRLSNWRTQCPGRLRRAGYQTAFFGKWGIGDSPERTHEGAAVFDYWAGQPAQTNYFHESDCRYVNFDGFHPATRTISVTAPPTPEGRQGTTSASVETTLVAPIHVDSQVTPLHVKRFLDGRDKSRPFCMMLFFKSPHGPFTDWDPSLVGRDQASLYQIPCRSDPRQRGA